jgi:hypothetical protein
MISQEERQIQITVKVTAVLEWFVYEECFPLDNTF